MKTTECNLCSRGDIDSGKDTLLYENEKYYIIDNGNTHLEKDGKLQFAKRRISLILKKHKSILTNVEQQKVESILENFIQKKLNLIPDEDYFLRKTMGTYPEHYHLHAYMLPFKNEGKIISVGSNTDLI